MADDGGDVFDGDGVCVLLEFGGEVECGELPGELVVFGGAVGWVCLGGGGWEVQEED